jgi:hypothetical protein
MLWSFKEYNSLAYWCKFITAVQNIHDWKERSEADSCGLCNL